MAVYDLSTQKPHSIFSPEISPKVTLATRPRTSAIAWCPTRRHEVAWLQIHDRYLRVANVHHLQESTSRARATRKVTRGEILKYSPDGHRLAVLVDDSSIEIYRVVDHRQDLTYMGVILAEALAVEPGTLSSFSWLRNDIVVLAHNCATQDRLSFAEFTIPSAAWHHSLDVTRTITITNRARATTADVTQLSGIMRAAHYDPLRKYIQVTNLSDLSSLYIQDNVLRRSGHCPPISFFDNGRALVMSCSGRAILYDLQSTKVSQVLAESDEDMMLAVDQFSRRVAILHRNWWLWRQGYTLTVHSPTRDPSVGLLRMNRTSSWQDVLALAAALIAAFVVGTLGAFVRA